MNPISRGEYYEESNGNGAFFEVYYEDSIESEQLKITIHVDVWIESNIRESSKYFLLLSGENMLLPYSVEMNAVTVDLTASAAYAACVAAQVGAQVWKDYEDCKKQARVDNPNFNWAQVRAEAFKCLAHKHPNAVGALKAALISCSPALGT
ncbi:MAG: hypothetical protein AAF367_19435 [Pseudomonadota bacterium]